MSVAPGWYPDPADPATQRFWDGEQWIGERLPVGAPTDGPPSPSPLPPPSIEHRALGHRPTAPPAPPLVEVRLATVGHRLAARLIDVTVLVMLNIVVNGYFVYELAREVAPTLDSIKPGQQQLPAFSDRTTTLVLVINVLALALWFAYEVPGLASTGQTPGKRLTGIRVMAAPDKHGLGFRRAIVRWACMGLPSALGLQFGVPFLLIDSLWCTWDRPARQCLHDKFAATVVVHAE